ncbi:MAG: hypothetical protein ACJA1Z_000259 [Patiriisocius sp.]|jgi:hypothetical protein
MPSGLKIELLSTRLGLVTFLIGRFAIIVLAIKTKSNTMKIIKYIVGTLIGCMLWGAFIFFEVSNGFLLKSIATADSPEAFIKEFSSTIEKNHKGNLAMALIENGQISKEYFYSVDQPVTN